MPQSHADQRTFNNELRGALFRNDKGDNPARPDYRGNCQIDGKKYRISAWLRTAQSGMTFMSMAYTLDQTAPPDAQGQPTAPVAPPVPDDDIPF